MAFFQNDIGEIVVLKMNFKFLNYEWWCLQSLLRDLFPRSVYIQPSKQIHFPKIFTLLKERGILNILNKPDGNCVALCIPCDVMKFDLKAMWPRKVAHECCSSISSCFQ